MSGISQVGEAGVGEAPPKTGVRRSVAFLAGSLAGGNLVSTVVRLVAGVLLGRLVAPATLGLFNGIGLVLGYIPFLQLGILNGLNRELPYYVGKNDYGRVRELASAALAWALVVGGAVGVVLLCIGGYYVARKDWWRAAGWCTNAVLAFFLFYNTSYLQNTFRTAHDFARLALVGVVESMIGLGMLLAVAFLNFYGLCLRALVVSVVSTAVLYLWQPIQVGPRWARGELKRLLVIGAPIFIVGQLYALWVTLNSTLVLRYAGTEGMGLFSMVLVASAALEFLPLAISQVVYPRMAESYGRTSSLDDMVRIASKPVAVTAVGMVPVVCVAWAIVTPLVKFLIPAYVAAIPAMRWSFLLALVTSFQPMNSIFNVVRRQDLYLVAMILGMTINVGTLMLLMRGGTELAAFPQSMLVGRVVYMVMSYLLLWRLVRRSRCAPLAP